MAGELGRRAFLKILGVVAGGTAIGLDPILGRFAAGPHHVLVPAPPDPFVPLDPAQLVEIARTIPALPPLFHEWMQQVTDDVLRFLIEHLKDQEEERFGLVTRPTVRGDATRVRDPFPPITVKTLLHGPITQTVRAVPLDQQYTVDFAWTDQDVHERPPADQRAFIRDAFAAPIAAQLAHTIRKKRINLFATLPMPGWAGGSGESVVAVDERAALAVRGLRVFDLLNDAGPTHRVRIDILGGRA